MKVLGLDTATLTSGIAIVDDRKVLAEARHDGSARTADLLVAIDRVCKEAGVAPMELDAVAVGAGPGSFTGLRIGMATAKGIAFATGKPLWAVSSLAALAWDGRATVNVNDRLDEYYSDIYFAVLDARRGEVFAGAYWLAGERWAQLGEERVLSPADFVTWAHELVEGVAPRPDPLPHVRFAGDGIDAYPDALASRRDHWLAPRTPSGVAVAKLALSGTRVDVLVGGGPTYIRPSEAEVMYPDGVPGALRKRDP